jgi:hypothetical protein
MPLVKKSNILDIPVDALPLVDSSPKPVKAVAYGRELSEYELIKDRKIGIAGIVQAVIQSPIYAQQLVLETDPAKADAFLKEKAEMWVNFIKEQSEK